MGPLYFRARKMSRLVAAFVLVVTAPLSFFVILWILVQDRRPIFFRQVRLGRYGERFELLKFRTMEDKRDRALTDVSGQLIGASILRALAFDEIPNFYNVLKGDMVLFGPRAMPVEYEEYINTEFPERTRVYPGLLGLAQCKCTYKDSFRKRFKYDVFFIKHKNPKLLILVFLLTFKSMLLSRAIFSASQEVRGL